MPVFCRGSLASRYLSVLILISEDGRVGADKLAFAIAKGLKQKGHRVIWGCPSDCILIPEARNAGLEIYCVDWSGNMDMRPLINFMRFCRAEKIEIVNVHQSHGRHLLEAAKLMGLKAKAVFTRHCITNPAPLVGGLFSNLVLDMTITVSEVIRKGLLLSGVMPGNVTRIYGGIDIDHFGQVPDEEIRRVRQQYAVPKVFTIGMVARFELHKSKKTDKPSLKRHEVLFRALAGLEKDFILLLVGFGDRDNIMRLAQENELSEAKIIYCGFQDDVAPFYKLMDLHVLPSVQEGLGLVVIEGMAAGVACIGADSGGISEIISDGEDGYLFPPGDSRELNRRIRTLMEDKGLRDTFIAKGKEKVKSKFDIKNTVLETEKVFYSIINQGVVNLG